MNDLLVREKLAYFHQRSQYVVFTVEGRVKESCQTLFEIPAAASVYQSIPFMEAMQEAFTQLPVGNDVSFLCINTSLLNRKGYYNFYIKRESEETFKWFVYDLTEFYSYLQPWQQERNEQAIAGEYLRLQQRAAALEKELLQYQHEELQRIEQMKTAFFSQVSHEMRTPLHSIVGLAHLLAEQAAPSMSNSVQALKTTAQHLTTIVNDVLDWAKLENSTIEIRPAPFQIRTLVQSVAEAFRYGCQEKGIELLVHLSNSVPEYLIGDATRLAQILYNVLGNAVKFTEQGEIKLSVDATSVADASVAQLRFSVSDTGIGMTEEEQKRIINPYTQANEQIHQHYGGTGLGLSIVQKLVERFEGTWTIASQPRQGTTVTIDLSLPLGEAPKEEAEHQPSAFQSIQRVLVAEDDTINQKVITQLLTQWGLHPTVVDNGTQALQRLQTQAYDLLILDYQMPEVDGVKVLEILQQERRLVPTIVVSGNAHQIVLPSSTEETTLTLSKPILPTTLLEKMLTLDRQISSSSINLKYLRQITGNQPELIIELMDTFVQQAPLAIAKVRQAWQNKDLEQLQRAAHKAKPGFQYVGATEIEYLLSQLEDYSEQSASIQPGETIIDRLEKLTKEAIQHSRHARQRILPQVDNKAPTHRSEK